MQQLTSRPQPRMYPNMPPRNPRSTENVTDRSTIVLITALILFAFSGLLTGFAVGAINRPHHTPANTGTRNSPGNNATAPAKTGSTQKTPTVTIVPIGCPVPDVYTPAETADGQSSYTVSAYATEHSNDSNACGGNQLMNAGITFKLWLTQQIPLSDSINFPQGAQALFSSINNPLVGKDMNKSGKSGGDIQDTQALQFASTSQVQLTDAQGRVTWKYTLPTSLQPGNYSLVVLADWQGKQYNWSWRNITIKKAD